MKEWTPHVELPDPDRSIEELVADFRAATNDLKAAIGTASEDAVVQRVANAVGALILRGSASQLEDLGIHTEFGYSVVLPSSDPDAVDLREAITRRDIDRVRTLLSERKDIPASFVDEIWKSLMGTHDDLTE